MGLGHTHRFGKGCSLSEGLLYGLIVAVVLFSGFAMFHSVGKQPHVATTYTSWVEDKKGHDRALAAQKETHRPMLVYIYAPWCPHCKEFSKDILSNANVRSVINQYPHVRIAPDHGPEEQQLMTHYGASGYPAFYVVMPNGTPHQVATFITTPTMRAKTPNEFIQSLRSVIGH